MVNFWKFVFFFFEYWCACCWWSLTGSETISDKLGNHLWQAQKPSLTSSETISDKLRNHLRHMCRLSLEDDQHAQKKFCWKIGQHLTKMHWIALFIGLPDGEVMKKHLTRDPTRTPTNHPSTPITQHPTPGTQMVWCLVRCLVRCWANTSPSETRCSKGFSGILVRCRAKTFNKLLTLGKVRKSKNFFLFLVFSLA